MNLYGIQLEIMLVALGVAALLTHAFRPAIAPRAVGGWLAAGVAAILLYSFTLQPVAEPLFQGLYRLDGAALFFKRLLLAGTVLALVLAMEFPAVRAEGVEFFTLTLFAAAGMLLLASVNEFVFLFVALELVAVCFYVLTSFLRRDTAALKAGVKYLVMGALSASLTVYGIA